MVELLDGLSTLVLLAGAGLVILEAFAPSGHFIVLGIALLAAGLVGVLAPLQGIAVPLAMAGTALVTGIGALYVYREFDIYGGEEIDRTSDSDSLRGSTGRVTRRVTETDGEVKLDSGGFSPHYQARAVRGTIPEGEEVTVVDPGGGNVLTVESMAAVDDIDRELAAESTSTPDAGATPEAASESDPDLASERDPDLASESDHEATSGTDAATESDLESETE